MARYSRVRGPATNFQVPTSPIVIPGISLTRTFGDGTLIIAATVSVISLNPTPMAYNFHPVLDGVRFLDTAFGQWSLEPGQFQAGSWWVLQPISRGQHTLEVHISAGTASTLRVSADGTEFSVIELPEWDRDDFLVSV